MSDGKYKCGCGRSPNGKCIGWHGLSEEEDREALAEHDAKVIQTQQQQQQ